MWAGESVAEGTLRTEGGRDGPEEGVGGPDGQKGGGRYSGESQPAGVGSWVAQHLKEAPALGQDLRSHGAEAQIPPKDSEF